MLVSLRCEPAMADAAAHAEAALPRSQRGGPLLSNERLHFEGGTADLMKIYLCALWQMCLRFVRRRVVLFFVART